MENHCLFCYQIIPEGRQVCPNCMRYYMHYENNNETERRTVMNWKEWFKAAGIRAIRTFAEAMLAYIGTGAIVLGDVNWIAALSAGAFGAVSALLLALAGLPELHPPEKK